MDPIIPVPGSGPADEGPSTTVPAASDLATSAQQVESIVDLAAAYRRRERLIEDYDRTRASLWTTKRELARTAEQLAKAQGTKGYRLERAARRRARAVLNRVRSRPTRDPDRRPTAAGPVHADAAPTGDPGAQPGTGPDPATSYRAEMVDRLSGTFALGRRPVQVAIAGLPSAGADASASTDGRARQILASLASVGLAPLLVAADPAEKANLDAIDVVLFVGPIPDLDRWPRGIIRVAWLGDQVDRWLERGQLNDVEVVLVPDEPTKSRVEAGSAKTALAASDPSLASGAAALKAALLSYVLAPRVAIHIGPLTREAAASWGDTPFGYDVQRAFERRGWPASVHVYAERDSAPAIRADLALHIMGVRAPAVRPWQTSVLWIISHPDLVRLEMCRPYHLVGVGSDVFLRYLRACPQAADLPPLIPLHQATEPARFFPEPGGPAHEILFVGSSRNIRRPSVDALAGTAHDLAVYGRNWTADLLDPRYLRGEWIPNAELHRLYASAAIVLSDSLTDMREEGFITNRVYDALASGGFVISEEVPGLDAEFDGAVVTYRDGAELVDRVEHFLDHPEERNALAAKGRSAVLARHTFGHRVDAIIEAVEPRLAARFQRPGARSGGVPTPPTPALGS